MLATQFLDRAEPTHSRTQGVFSSFSRRGRAVGTKHPKIVLVAALIEALKRIYPEARFAGVGGQAMTNAGLEAWHDCSELAVIEMEPRQARARQSLNVTAEGG
jgi:hypothetical protein